MRIGYRVRVLFGRVSDAYAVACRTPDIVTRPVGLAVTSPLPYPEGWI